MNKRRILEQGWITHLGQGNGDNTVPDKRPGSRRNVRPRGAPRSWTPAGGFRASVYGCIGHGQVLHRRLQRWRRWCTYQPYPQTVGPTDQLQGMHSPRWKVGPSTGSDWKYDGDWQEVRDVAFPIVQAVLRHVYWTKAGAPVHKEWHIEPSTCREHSSGHNGRRIGRAAVEGCGGNHKLRCGFLLRKKDNRAFGLQYRSRGRIREVWDAPTVGCRCTGRSGSWDPGQQRGLCTSSLYTCSQSAVCRCARCCGTLPAHSLTVPVRWAAPEEHAKIRMRGPPYAAPLRCRA